MLCRKRRWGLDFNGGFVRIPLKEGVSTRVWWLGSTCTAIRWKHTIDQRISSTKIFKLYGRPTRGLSSPRPTFLLDFESLTRKRTDSLGQVSTAQGGRFRLLFIAHRYTETRKISVRTLLSSDQPQRTVCELGFIGVPIDIAIPQGRIHNPTLATTHSPPPTHPPQSLIHKLTRLSATMGYQSNFIAHLPATLLFLTSTVFLALSALNTPLIKSLYFLKATYTTGSNAGEVSFGTLGFCFERGAGESCTGPKIGYQIG